MQYVAGNGSKTTYHTIGLYYTPSHDGGTVMPIKQMLDAGMNPLPSPAVVYALQAAGNWQKPLLPYSGGSMGLELAFLPNGLQRERDKAFLRTGDMCIQYKNGKIPHNTQTRCLSQQFWRGTDAQNWPVCMGISTGQVGTFVVDSILKPVLKMLPGDLGSKTGMMTILQNIISEKAGKKLDDALGKMPFPFGFIWTKVDWFIGKWFGFSYRNMLTHEKKEILVPGNTALRDYSMDSTMAHMRRVYSEDGTDCPRTTREGRSGPGSRVACKDSIGVRSAGLVGMRYGDSGRAGPLDNLWSERSASYSQRLRLTVSFTKQSMCLALPVCNTVLIESKMDQFDNAGQNRDCSGHGQCRWNKRKGLSLSTSSPHLGQLTMFWRQGTTASVIQAIGTFKTFNSAAQHGTSAMSI